MYKDPTQLWVTGGKDNHKIVRYYQVVAEVIMGALAHRTCCWALVGPQGSSNGAQGRVPRNAETTHRGRRAF
jgi:hypothetical protein